MLNVFKFKCICDVRYLLLSQYINTTCQIKLVKIVVNEQDEASKYLNNKKRRKRIITKKQMPRVQSVGAKTTRFKKLIIEGAFYIGVVRNRFLCKRSVIRSHKAQFWAFDIRYVHRGSFF